MVLVSTPAPVPAPYLDHKKHNFWTMPFYIVSIFHEYIIFLLFCCCWIRDPGWKKKSGCFCQVRRREEASPASQVVESVSLLAGASQVMGWPHETPQVDLAFLGCFFCGDGGDLTFFQGFVSGSALI